MKTAVFGQNSMKLSCLLLPFFAVLVAGTLPAAPAAGTERLRDFDRRGEQRGKAVEWAPRQKDALDELKRRVPEIEAEIDSTVGSPKWLRARNGFLTGPNGEGRAVSAKAAQAFAPADADRPTKAVLHEHRELFGHGPEVLLSARRTRDYVTTHNRLRTVVWEQQLDGIPVYEAMLLANVTGLGELASLSSQFLPDPEQAAKLGTPERIAGRPPSLQARAALRKAVDEVGEEVADSAIAEIGGPAPAANHEQRFRAGGLPGEARAHLIWLPLDRQRLRLCWAVELTRRERGERFRVLVDSENGQVLLRRCLTFDLSEATYRVFTSDSPSPFSPGLSVPSRFQPPLVPRALMTLSALDTNASPLGWIRDGENETLGNNVDAHLDRNGDNVPDLPRPSGSPFRVFDYPLDLTQSPTNTGAAAVVQLFYWCNWMHDKLYELGFTEATGNFQKDTFGRGGLGNSVLQADAQDGSGFNNANFTPSPEGQSPRIQMFLFNGPDPWRDADLDAEVILHEYTHGMTDRLVGGGVGLSGGDQTFGMSEGWSDFYALTLLSEESDDPDGVYAYGGYMTYLFTGLRENYYFGIRRYPYTTDLSKNPLTMGNIYTDDVTQHPDVPRNPIITSSGPEVHRIGEIWCSALWQARANLIHKYGFQKGNQLILQLVTDGMKLSPANPNFVQARDAILLADQVDNGGANRIALWEAFAKRGIGVGAVACDIRFICQSAIESFEIPPALQIQPVGGFVAGGPPSGPFAPDAQTFTVSNLRSDPLPFAVQSTATWLTVTPTNGVVARESSTAVQVAIKPEAQLLPAGVYSNSIMFFDLTTNRVISASVVLKVGQRDWLVEVFSAGDFDLDKSSLTFTPDGSTNFYSACRSPAFEFPADPAGGTDAPMVDDSYRLISLADGAEISLFGVRSNKFFLGSNGDVVYEVPSYYTYNPSLDLYTQQFNPGIVRFLERRRVGGLYADLNPSDGGLISWKQWPDRVAITYQDVPEFGTADHNNLQMELFFDGMIRFTYAGVAASNAIVGLSSGGGALGFVESNLGAKACYPPLQLVLPSRITEGDASQTGTVNLARAATHDILVRLQSSDSNTLSVSRAVIQSGQTSATFPIITFDDLLLNGSRFVSITAETEEFDRVSATIEVADNEHASLSLTLPAKVTEGDGALPNQGVVTVNARPAGPIVVGLASSDPALVGVPPTVTIPAGQTLATFDLNIGDNADYDPTRTVSVVASVSNWEPGRATVDVADNEPTLLTLSLPVSIAETNSTLTAAGRAELGGVVRTNFTIHLVSDAPGALQVPATVIVPAGQRSATFNLLVINNHQARGPLSVTVTASAAGFVSAHSAITIVDDESPSAPEASSPLDLATRVPITTALVWSIEQTPSHGTAGFEVYFGTNPVPGRAEFQGRTNATNWPLPPLALGTTYYWQVIAAKGNARVPGPIWRFTTARLSRFEIHQPASSQQVNAGFPIEVVARDENMQTATSFKGPVSLGALAAGPAASTIVITEVDTGTPGFGQVEFANACGQNIDISGWQIALYDWASWPAPRTLFNIPNGTICRVGDLFVLRCVVTTATPGTYPLFFAGTNMGWNYTAIGNPIAVMLRDRTGNVVDFFCAADSDPAQITQPVPVPAAQWSSGPVPAKLSTTNNYQRVGNADHNQASDWALGAKDIGARSPGLQTPFTEQRAIRLTPDTLRTFVQGVWTGQVAIAELANNLNLHVEDGQGHSGDGPGFSVIAPNDLSVTVSAPSAVARVGSPFTYTIVVANRGPSISTGVVLRDNLPPQMELISANSSQGVCHTAAGQVICDLGTLAANTSASAIVQVRPTAPGLATNQVLVARLEPEAFVANNTASVATAVDYSWLIAAGTSVREGNSGSTNAVFVVQLSDPSSEVVTVDFFTSDGTAMAGSDYAATNGTLMFPPGVTNASVTVTIYGDTHVEPNETFFLNLSRPTNAALAASQVKGTIVNDDFLPDVGVSISDSSVIEGDEGVTPAEFMLTLSAPATVPVTVFFSTVDNTALAGLDYIATNGVVDIPVGATNRAITVAVLGDRLFEPNENFSVILNSAVNAYFQRRGGTCLILDDDAAQLDHFAWSDLGATQVVNVPFAASLTALDALGRTVTNFNGTARLKAVRTAEDIAIGADTTPWQYPLAASFEDARLQVIYPSNEVGRAGRITALALNAQALPGQTLSNWTIRLKQTSQASYQSAVWENSGWTSVYQAGEELLIAGWHTFVFQTPFDYDGIANLMVDFSFHNGHFSSDGLCLATATTPVRSLAFRTDGAFGDPLQWSGVVPPAVSAKMVPNVRFSIGTPVPATPVVSGNFADGIWSGDISLLNAAADVVLLAQDSSGHVGKSSPIQAVAPPPSNGSPTTGNTTADSDRTLLRISVVEQTGTSFRLSFPTLSGERYQIESADSLSPAIWSPVGSPITGAGRPHEFPASMQEYSHRFYRVEWLK